MSVGNRQLSRDDAMAVLGNRMERLPTTVSETRTVPLGTFRGLAFGLILHVMGGLEAYLDGNILRRADLRDGAGPRAVLNALDRLAGGYATERERAEQDKAVAEGQLRDYESRLGTPFAHDIYQRELADLRDKLKIGLSDKATEQADGPSVPELAEKIKTLRATNAVEAAPQRVGSRSGARAERPVTARIKVKAAEEPEPQAVEPPPVQQKPVDTDESDDTPGGPVIVMPKAPATETLRHAQRVTQRRKAGGGQPSLFD